MGEQMPAGSPTSEDARSAGDERSRASARAAVELRSPRIGLALSSGGARGFAHVGVIKALREAGFSVVDVAGSSIGGIIAAGYAVRGDVCELERWVLDFRARDYSRRALPIMDPPRLTAFLDEILGGASFADCAVPLRIVATDLRARAATTIDEGSVALAAFASSAMPFLHRPVPWDDRLLADGSLSCVLPLAQASAPEVDLVIGSLVSRRLPALHGFATGLARTAGGAIRGWSRPYIDYFCDRTRQLPWPTGVTVAPVPTLVLNPELRGIGPLDFGRMREAIRAGEEATLMRLDEVRALLSRGADLDRA